MKGLIFCFAVLCLSFASGAPSPGNEYNTFDSQGLVVNSSSDLIFPQNLLQNGEMIYAICEGTSSKLEKKCKIYADVGRDIIQSCDLNLNYTGWHSVHPFVTLFSGGNSKAVFVSREDQNHVILTSVDFKDCQTAEARINVPLTKFLSLRAEVYVVFNEKNYQVVFRNHDYCGKYYCIGNFGYDGTVIREYNAFPVEVSDFGIYQIEYANGSLLVSESFLGVVYVHLYRGDNFPQTVYHLHSTVDLSVDANKIGYCVIFSPSNAQCTQYDFDGKTKIAEFDIQGGNSSQLVYQSLLNVEKGILALAYGVIADFDDKNDHSFVVHFDENGKQGKYVKIEPSGCGKLQLDQVTKLYKNSKGEYCALYPCFTKVPTDSELQLVKIHRHETCIPESELF